MIRHWVHTEEITPKWPIVKFRFAKPIEYIEDTSDSTRLPLNSFLGPTEPRSPYFLPGCSEPSPHPASHQPVLSPESPSRSCTPVSAALFTSCPSTHGWLQQPPVRPLLQTCPCAIVLGSVAKGKVYKTQIRSSRLCLKPFHGPLWPFG